MEYIDVLDENGVKTGEILSRKEIHQRGLWHRAIVIAIINGNNEVLLQQLIFISICSISSNRYVVGAF